MDELPRFWQQYFEEVDHCIEENFWGNLASYKKCRLFEDPYIGQLEAMGYSFDTSTEAPAPFHHSLTWIFKELNALIATGAVNVDTVLWPAKAFRQGTAIHYIPFGGEIPHGSEALNLLTPEVFVDMLAQGYFPIGNAEREHTNQSLAEHDLAHMAGFISCPRYMAAVREAFRRVQEKTKSNPRLLTALQDFDSAYSLRLYYMIEVFTEIPEEHRAQLQELIEIPLDRPCIREEVNEFLRHKAREPADLYQYLAKLYWAFHQYTNPLGGESRDILNRTRKFKRGSTTGSFYDAVSKLSSKFARNSLYSLYYNGQAALDHIRSNHPEFERSIYEIHAPFIGALLGTSQLDVEDWVLSCIEETPDPSSKLYHYIAESGFWDERHLLYRAYCGEDYEQVLDDF
jgi:hypothetical protein